MTRFMTILFSIMLIAVSLVGLTIHEPVLSYVVGFSPTWIVGRLLLAAFLLAYPIFLPGGTYQLAGSCV